MRQLWINISAEQVDKILDLAKKHISVNTFRLPLNGVDQAHEMVVLNVANHSIGPILESLGNLDSVEINLLPVDGYPLQPETRV